VVYISFVLNMNSPPQKNRAYLEQFWHLKSNVASAWAEHTESNLCCLRSAVCSILSSHKQDWQYMYNITLWHIYLTVVALEMWPHVLYFRATYITVSDARIFKVAMEVHQWVPYVVELWSIANFMCHSACTSLAIRTASHHISSIV
jgi:hypothetical protein